MLHTNESEVLESQSLLSMGPQRNFFHPPKARDIENMDYVVWTIDLVQPGHLIEFHPRPSSSAHYVASHYRLEAKNIYKLYVIYSRAYRNVSE
jgi:hypothetical protein